MKRCSHSIVWGIVDSYKHGKPRNNCRCTRQAYYAGDGKKAQEFSRKGLFYYLGNNAENAQETMLEVNFLSAVIYNSKCLECRLLGQAA